MTISVADSVASTISALLSLHHKAFSQLQQQQCRVYFDKHPLEKPVPLTGATQNKGKHSNVTLKSVLWESRETATEFSIYTL